MPLRPRFTLWRMMVAVALAALISAAVRGYQHPSLAAGASIVGGCLVLMTARLARDRLARDRAAGASSGRRRTIRVVLGSAGRALILVVAGNFVCFAFAIVFGMMGRLPPAIEFLGLGLSLGMAVWVTYWLRKGSRAEISFGPLEVRSIPAQDPAPGDSAGAIAAEPIADVANPEA